MKIAICNARLPFLNLAEKADLYCLNADADADANADAIRQEK